MTHLQNPAAEGAKMAKVEPRDSRKPSLKPGMNLTQGQESVFSVLLDSV